VDGSRTPWPKRFGSFCRRHRATILTVALVVYTIALGVIVADEVLDFGLFPTKLERRARALTQQFDHPDERTRREAAAKLIRDIDAFVAVPELLRVLSSGSPERRALAVDCLRKLTKAENGFDPDAPPAERRAAIARWRRWWRENERRF